MAKRAPSIQHSTRKALAKDRPLRGYSEEAFKLYKEAEKVFGTKDSHELYQLGGIIARRGTHFEKALNVVGYLEENDSKFNTPEKRRYVEKMLMIHAKQVATLVDKDNKSLPRLDRAVKSAWADMSTRTPENSQTVSLLKEEGYTPGERRALTALANVVESGYQAFNSFRYKKAKEFDSARFRADKGDLVIDILNMTAKKYRPQTSASAGASRSAPSTAGATLSSPYATQSAPSLSAGPSPATPGRLSIVASASAPTPETPSGQFSSPLTVTLVSYDSPNGILNSTLSGPDGIFSSEVSLPSQLSSPNSNTHASPTPAPVSPPTLAPAAPLLHPVPSDSASASSLDNQVRDILDDAPLPELPEMPEPAHSQSPSPLRRGEVRYRHVPIPGESCSSRLRGSSSPNSTYIAPPSIAPTREPLPAQPSDTRPTIPPVITNPADSTDNYRPPTSTQSGGFSFRRWFRNSANEVGRLLFPSRQRAQAPPTLAPTSPAPGSHPNLTVRKYNEGRERRNMGCLTAALTGAAGVVVGAAGALWYADHQGHKNSPSTSHNVASAYTPEFNPSNSLTLTTPSSGNQIPGITTKPFPAYDPNLTLGMITLNHIIDERTAERDVSHEDASALRGKLADAYQTIEDDALVRQAEESALRSGTAVINAQAGALDKANREIEGYKANAAHRQELEDIAIMHEQVAARDSQRIDHLLKSKPFEYLTLPVANAIVNQDGTFVEYPVESLPNGLMRTRQEFLGMAKAVAGAYQPNKVNDKAFEELARVENMDQAFVKELEQNSEDALALNRFAEFLGRMQTKDANSKLPQGLVAYEDEQGRKRVAGPQVTLENYIRGRQ